VSCNILFLNLDSCILESLHNLHISLNANVIYIYVWKACTGGEPNTCIVYVVYTCLAYFVHWIRRCLCNKNEDLPTFICEII
jgi:hypothetical protein